MELSSISCTVAPTQHPRSPQGLTPQSPSTLTRTSHLMQLLSLESFCNLEQRLGLVLGPVAPMMFASTLSSRLGTGTQCLGFETTAGSGDFKWVTSLKLPQHFGSLTFFHNNKIPCHSKLSESDNLEKKVHHQFWQCQKEKDVSDLKSSLICKENKNCDLIIKLQINC